MDLLNDFSFFLFQTGGTVFVKVLFLDNDPGLYVCGIPITIVWFAGFFLVLRARSDSNRYKKKGK